MSTPPVSKPLAQAGKVRNSGIWGRQFPYNFGRCAIHHLVLNRELGSRGGYATALRGGAAVLAGKGITLFLALELLALDGSHAAW